MNGLNRINIRLFTWQIRLYGGEGVKLYLWGPRIKFHKWHESQVSTQAKISSFKNPRIKNRPTTTT